MMNSNFKLSATAITILSILCSSINAFTHHDGNTLKSFNKQASSRTRRTDKRTTTTRLLRLPPSSYITSNKQKQQDTSLKAFEGLADIATNYNYFLSNFPLETQSGTAGFLTGVGDVLAQTKEGLAEKEKKKEAQEVRVVPAVTRLVRLIDLDRTKSFIVKGLGAGLIWNGWYHLSDGWVTDLMTHFDTIATPGSTYETVVRTVLSITLEQFVACPIVYALWDIPVPRLLSGESIDKIPEQVSSKLGPLLVENAKVWTFVNIIIYNIPLEFRVLALSTADVFWQAILSSSVTSEEEEQVSTTSE